MFILDESNVLESSFLERINTLLANGEVSKHDQGVKHLCCIMLVSHVSEGPWPV